MKINDVCNLLTSSAKYVYVCVCVCARMCIGGSTCSKMVTISESRWKVYICSLYFLATSLFENYLNKKLKNYVTPLLRALQSSPISFQVKAPRPCTLGPALGCPFPPSHHSLCPHCPGLLAFPPHHVYAHLRPSALLCPLHGMLSPDTFSHIPLSTTDALSSLSSQNKRFLIPLILSQFSLQNLLLPFICSFAYHLPLAM